MKYGNLFIFIFLLSTATAFGQIGYQNSFWKNQRHTVGFGIGVTNFLGELGGRDQVGSDFIYDMEWKQTKPSLLVNYRYQLGQRFYTRAQFTFGFIGGDDALTEERFRRNRNLHFKSTIYEFSAYLIFDIVNFTNNSRYDRVNSAEKRGSSIYAIAGIGAVRFNPKGNYEGTWYELRDFGTEGQGQFNEGDVYSLWSFVLPFGLGYRYQLNRTWTVGCELMHRITFTDYMDDVSTVYYDNELISQTNGELAAYFADPSLGYYVDDNGNEIPLNSTETGYQRGDPEDNDAYFTFTINAYYKLPQKRRRGRGRTIKRRQRRVLF